MVVRHRLSVIDNIPAGYLDSEITIPRKAQIGIYLRALRKKGGRHRLLGGKGAGVFNKGRASSPVKSK